MGLVVIVLDRGSYNELGVAKIGRKDFSLWVAMKD